MLLLLLLLQMRLWTLVLLAVLILFTMHNSFSAGGARFRRSFVTMCLRSGSLVCLLLLPAPCVLPQKTSSQPPASKQATGRKRTRLSPCVYMLCICVDVVSEVLV